MIGRLLLKLVGFDPSNVTDEMLDMIEDFVKEEMEKLHAE